MGTYLSTPVKDKCEESGEALENLKNGDLPVEWGVVDMQGWRKSMEDAHTAVTSVPLRSSSSSDGESESEHHARVFGVYDGHGGAEVARFCQHYFVSVLTHQESWANGTGLPLAESDARVPPPPPPPTKSAWDGDGNEEGYRASHLPAASQTPVGRALREAFHAMDRMIDDPGRRAEIAILRTTKPGPGVTKILENGTNSIPPAPALAENPPDFYTPPGSSSVSTACVLDQARKEVLPDGSEKDGTVDEETAKEVEAKQIDRSLSMAMSPGDAEALKGMIEAFEENETNGDGSDDQEDADSLDTNEAVGVEEAIALDSNIDDNDNDGEANDDGEGTSSSPEGGRNVTTMLQKILSLGGSEEEGENGQAEAEPAPTPTPTPPVEPEEAVTDPEYPDAAVVSGASSRIPSVQHNGRLVCNLPDHPIHAGATAVVAVLTGRILTVSNAGDSRAVLCRRRAGANPEANAGSDCYAYPLSYDHKPSQMHERNRILRSGGFINHFGRINGNLNLSRSIGDLKYKQVPGIPPAHQMITAEPDIMQIALDPSVDEFFVLGCDGIWDCLTNQQAVDFVAKRIDTMSPTEIGREMLDEIISDDPRVSQGIGGDNMTVMIVDLQSKKRSRKSAAAPEAPQQGEPPSAGEPAGAEADQAPEAATE